MTHDPQVLRDDIAFLRALAEEGRETPMLGAPILLATGLIFGSANGLGLLLELGGRTSAGEMAALPLGAVALFLVVLSILKRRQGPVAASTVNRATGNLWRAVGWSAGLLFAGMALAAWRLGDWRLMAATPVMLFLLYGAAWQVAGAVARIPWLRTVALGSYATAFAIAWLAASPAPAAAVSTAGLFGLVALPGALLMRRAHAAAA